MDEGSGQGEKRARAVLRVVVLAIVGVLVLYFLGFIPFGAGSGYSIHRSAPGTSTRTRHGIQASVAGLVVEIQKVAALTPAGMPSDRDGGNGPGRSGSTLNRPT